MLGRLLLVRRGGDAAMGWFVLGLAALLGLLAVPMAYARVPFDCDE